MPTTRLQELQHLRARVDAEIAAEIARRRRRQQKHRDEVPAHVVRAWARDVGYQVGVRGAIGDDLLDAYLQAHEEERS